MSRLCAQHALNMLLQASYFTAADLADLAKELDDKERSVLSIPEPQFQSQNCDDSGFFSIQVRFLKQVGNISNFMTYIGDNPRSAAISRPPNSSLGQS